MIAVSGVLLVKCDRAVATRGARRFASLQGGGCLVGIVVGKVVSTCEFNKTVAVLVGAAGSTIQNTSRGWI
ncbi:hypothetical protein GOP47_0011717 [Adiantum capillus-veneris]|uniref:Uncharacterized protein n=1 Tax=Adiantum capillus-veneris TaxID=13818 RepID=A0A9D4ZFN2_ADICA|nr:hypothetical protein GOP47_0011717 [Adiantum capillus-veneris]